MTSYLLLFLSGLVAIQSDQPISALDLALNIKVRRSGLNSALVEYTTRTTIDKPLLESAYAKAFSSRSVYGFSLFKGEKRRSHLKSPNKSAEDWSWNGKLSMTRRGAFFAVETRKVGETDLNLYLASLLWTTSEVERLRCEHNPAESAYLPFFLTTDSWTSRFVTFRDRRAILLQNTDGSRRLWVDPSRNFTLLKFRSEHPFDQEPVEWTESEYWDHVPIAEGLYFPRRISSTMAINESARHTGKITTEVSLNDVRLVNNVPDSMFELQPDPGMRVHDDAKGVLYTYKPFLGKTLDSGLQEAAERKAKLVGATARYNQITAAAVFTVLTLVSVSLGRRFAPKTR